MTPTIVPLACGVDATAASVRVGTRTPITDATRVDFLEQPAASLDVRKGTATVLIAPHAISTILIR